MPPCLQIADAPIRRAQINHAQRVIDRHPEWSLRQLAFELCGDWNWRDHQKDLRIDACRQLLLELSKLEKLRGLPSSKRSRSSGWTKGDKWSEALAPDETPLKEPLHDLGKISIRLAHDHPGDLLHHRHTLAKYHPVGFKGPIGESMAYWVCDEQRRPLGTLLFGSSAWSCKDRDQWLGWSHDARKTNLIFTTNNTRFLILPWVKVPHLASHVLGRVVRRLNEDWMKKYGHPIHLLETFIDTSTYSGACYSAAGWRRIGKTTGRGCRAGKAVTKTIKDILVRPLSKNFKEVLCHVPA